MNRLEVIIQQAEELNIDRFCSVIDSESDIYILTRHNLMGHMGHSIIKKQASIYYAYSNWKFGEQIHVQKEGKPMTRKVSL